MTKPLSVADLLMSVYYLPSYAGVRQTAVLIEEDTNKQHLFACGDGAGAGMKHLALKYGFGYTAEFTAGLIADTSFDEAYRDAYHLLSGEEITMSVAIPSRQNQVPVIPNENAVVRQYPVERNTASPVVLPTVEERTDEQLIATRTDNSVVGQTRPGIRKTIDFAAIAKKMKESITPPSS